MRVLDRIVVPSVYMYICGHGATPMLAYSMVLILDGNSLHVAHA